MKALSKKVEKLNESELKKLMKIITERQNKLKIDKLIQQFVPDIFRNKIKLLTFETSFNDGSSYDDYNQINNYGWAEFDCNLTISTSYEISKTNPGQSVKLQLKQGKTKTNYQYDYEPQWRNKRPNTTILLLDKKLLNVLDVLELEHNLYNKKMLGVLIHNMLHNTETADDIYKESDYDTKAINIKNINELNSEESLHNDKYMIYDNYENESIRFKYVSKFEK
ncbi:hypothetical protein CE11_00059 [Megavirus courdo11]|uniref:Uncharacterized protein n=1 Tax=Megavirus courdo11 TaxID=1128140 RepID=K7Z786_9VIRU|nr:hypothetical protein CE11_00059 [Megavirus courdo11]